LTQLGSGCSGIWKKNYEGMRARSLKLQVCVLCPSGRLPT
jgi:hypothetical protein